MELFSDRNLSQLRNNSYVISFHLEWSRSQEKHDVVSLIIPLLPIGAEFTVQVTAYNLWSIFRTILKGIINTQIQFRNQFHACLFSGVMTK